MRLFTRERTNFQYLPEILYEMPEFGNGKIPEDFPSHDVISVKA